MDRLNGFDENGHDQDFGIIPSKQRVERKERKRINVVKFSNGRVQTLEFNSGLPANETNAQKQPIQNGRTKKSKKNTKLRLTRRFPFMKSVENVSAIDENTSNASNWNNSVS